MTAFVISVLWSIPFVVFRWLGMPWGWALFASVPVMAIAYWLYYWWEDHHG